MTGEGIKKKKKKKGETIKTQPDGWRHSVICDTGEVFVKKKWM